MSVTLQIPAKRLSGIIKTIHAEIKKNPNGFINVKFESVDENSFIPAFCWTPELDVPREKFDFIKIKKQAILKDYLLFFR